MAYLRVLLGEVIWWSCAHRGRAREQAGLVSPAMERLCAGLEGLALAEHAGRSLHGRPVLHSVCSDSARPRRCSRRARRASALEVDGQAIQLVGELRLGQVARVRVAPGDDRLGERGCLGVERRDERGRLNGGCTPGRRASGPADGAEELPGHGAGSWSDRGVDDPQWISGTGAGGRRNSASCGRTPRRISLTGSESAAPTIASALKPCRPVLGGAATRAPRAGPGPRARPDAPPAR